MMIQNTTFLRRAVGSLLVALVTLVGFQAQAQIRLTQSIELDWNEAHGFDETNGALQAGSANGGASLTLLNGVLEDALEDGTTTGTSCYTISGTAAYALEFPAALDCKTVATAPRNNGVLGSSTTNLAV